MDTTCNPILDQLKELYHLEEMESPDDTSYALDAEWRIVYINPAWSDFARRNGAADDFTAAWGVGADLSAALPAAVRDFYLSHYEACLHSGERWDHDYECSSPDTHRRFRQLVYPFGDGTGLLVVNSLIQEGPHAEAGACGSDPGAFLDPHGIVHQCCHCRRIKDQAGEGRWMWVPDLVARPHDPTSHGLCKVCLDHYYPPL